MTDEPFNLQKEEEEAIRTLAGTRDGALLHRYLRRILETVIDIETEGALRSYNGRRTLARDLMRLMAEGLDGRRTDHDNDPILTRSSSGAVVVGRARRDRNSLPRVDSYSDDLNPDGSAKSS